MTSLIAFTVTIVLLFIYSIFDFRDRKVSNQLMLVGCIAGVVMNVISGHFYNNLYLHLFALAFTIPISYVLFKLGAFGGADTKALISVAIISPGFEFISRLNPLVEAVIATSIKIMIMLSVGYLWWFKDKRSEEETLPPPLIPLLLLGYVFVTSLASITYFI